jgi:hypothetical protein
VLLVVTLPVLLAPPVCAQDRASQRAYQRIVTEAVAEFDAGRWEEARALFEQAHDLSPSARTLRGMGMCAFELRRYDETLDLLAQALADERRPLTRRQRTEVEDLMRRARTFIGRFRVTVEPEGAELWVDDAPAALEEDGSLTLSVGVHVLEGRLEGHASETRRLEVRGEEDEAITLSLAPEAPARVVIASTTPVEAIATFASAGGALLVEVWAIGWLVNRSTELDACASPPMGLLCANRPTIVEQRDAALATTVVAAVATLGLVATGVGLWLVHASGGAASDQLACAVGPGGVGCAGRF